MPALELVTIGLVRELTSGDAVVGLAADPTLASFGDEEDALLEARMFLSENALNLHPPRGPGPTSTRPRPPVAEFPSRSPAFRGSARPRAPPPSSS